MGLSLIHILSRTEQSDVLLAAIPYSSISDSTITVSNSEIKDLYNKKKGSFEQPVETRNIKYIDVLVTPSDEDRKEVLNEVTEMCIRDSNYHRKSYNDKPYSSADNSLPAIF